jgi:hypothetical protein
LCLYLPAGTIDPQHEHVAGGVVAAGIRVDLVKRSIATATRQLAHAGVLADRPEAGLLA